MRLHEYQAKQIFAKYGIKIPKGKLATTVEEVRKIAEELGGKVVLKSQILVGGRGKAGGIKLANSVEEAVEIAKDLFGKVIKGHRVEKIYVEEQLNIQREMYVGLTLDRAEKGIALIVSSVGGMDIEEIAAKHPEKIARITINPLYGLWDFQIREVLYKSGMPKELHKEITGIIKALYKILIDHEAELTEINPLVLTDKGLFAADARLNVDDNALYRHPELKELRDYTEVDQIERIAEEKGLNYVKLDGNIGVIANGAGMSMSTMDLIYLEGGKPANFLDIGGGASSEVVKEAIKTILMDKNVKVIFMNIFGGITRCDEVAKGLVKAFQEIVIPVPIVLRLAGTNEEEGRRIIEEFLEREKKNIIVVETMEEGAKKAVELAR
ncbi:succinyl-CoA synthetase, beta subunit [Ferroglobus placidus DSM 10642]|uniref:Succinate--CoA ligase [ADP-forming] subunit beta n=1 Tax=Ferroglobus placidus (strain DSM 10642 / AEDII12DO) TaxID=589924 RepID=D3RY32_FERPA|nr:ADP-forming succinate--CoA ligase subunit beta [Ferroglobus placidus]ADC65395.1 succinyl-CoA synthetase, beta subunit [Ferroglobus placidus DSM 10642]